MLSRLRVPSWKKSRRPLATDSANELEGWAPPNSCHPMQPDAAASETAARLRFNTQSAELPSRSPRELDGRSVAGFRCDQVPVLGVIGRDLHHVLLCAGAIARGARALSMHVYSVCACPSAPLGPFCAYSQRTGRRRVRRHQRWRQPQMECYTTHCVEASSCRRTFSSACTSPRSRLQAPALWH